MTPEPHGRHSPPRVLVAEDDPEMRRLVVDVLRKDGYDMAEAADGGRLLIAITAHGASPMPLIDLIISDIRMPICTGLQILENLHKTRWKVPVILMTAFGDDDTRAQAARFDALLFDKPFAIDDLRTAVRAMLSRP